jgi:hypothetical protein
MHFLALILCFIATTASAQYTDRYWVFFEEDSKSEMTRHLVSHDKMNFSPVKEFNLRAKKILPFEEDFWSERRDISSAMTR